MKAEININLENVAYNFETLRKIACCEDNVIPVVKANAYNIGIYNVVSTLLNIKNPQKKYFVFALIEGIELRNLFSQLEKIFVLGGILKGDEVYFKKYNLTPVVNDFEQLKLCVKSDINEVVLQFDSGMNRSGISMSEIKKVKEFIEKNKIKVLMVMSHFCYASNIMKPINSIQIENFKKIVSYFPDKEILKSLSASDGIYGFNLENLCNSCRPGLILYGYYNGFKPAYSIYSIVKSDENNLFLPLGIENGFTSEYGRQTNYVIIEGEKVYIKSISENKIILNSNDKKLIDKKATILGENITLIDFEKMVGTDIRDIVARIICNCDNDPKNFKINTERKRLINDAIPLKAYAVKNKDGEYEEFISTILEKRIVENDGVVGYCATENVKKGDKLATFFGGYLDGMYRGISNKKCRVFVKNKKGKLIACEIFGRISMDQTIIKIPEKEFNNIEIGAKVIIFDKDHTPDIFSKATGKSKNELFFYLDKSSRILIINK